MKKSSILAFSFALLAGSAFAQTAQEVTYTEDPQQGYLFNQFKDNWFIQAEGGVAMRFDDKNQHRNFGDRLAPAASLYVGKWFSPIIGARLGADFVSLKGLTQNEDALGVRPWETIIEKNGQYYGKTKVNYFGPSFDVMISLTNWWCGYKPNRVYNAYVYAGGGLYWAMVKTPKAGTTNDFEWKNSHDRTITIRAGLTQEFNLSKRFALGLDLRALALNNSEDNGQKTSLAAEALLTATYKFGKSTWNAPVVPVVVPGENCDEYRARLQAADARIADLEAQLKACLSRPVEKETIVTKAPLATIYYPCAVYRLTSVDKKVVQSVANVMKADTNKKYTLTGWADNYTGTEAYNIQLRKNRVETVKNQLIKYGVNADQLNATTNNGNRTDLGDKCLTLDRAVTIEVAD